MAANEVAVLSDLLERCTRGDQASWGVILGEVYAVCHPIFMRLTRARHIDESYADDLDQELYLYLSDNKARQLSLFRGRDVRSLQAYLRRLGLRFGRQRLASLMCMERRAVHFVDEDEQLPADEASEFAEMVHIVELGETLPVSDRRHLDIFLGRVECSGVSARTRRRWAETLGRHIADRLH